jgi:hypothetical protein
MFTIRAVLRIVSMIMLSVSTTCIFAQDVGNQDKNFAVSVDVQLVQLPVSVLDKDGHPINGLRKEDFEIFEDGVQQEISWFAPKISLLVSVSSLTTAGACTTSESG